ncbi:MAG: glycosyl hydrolase 53 family protein [Muribaculaceae bacterium]|nr:glycosyl hydrolase 53 family protein [Muribaculaceae bacterium]
MKKLMVTLALLFAAVGARANVVGGDISMLTQYEAKGAKYYDVNGRTIASVLPWLKEQGWNAMRVRLFVDPSQASATEQGEGVCQDLEYVKALGARIKAAGFKLLLDFHYSDTWADPVKQFTPASWVELDDEALNEKLYSYTRECLQAMVDAGATPDYIQTGNEISYGMLWGPVGTPNSQLKKFTVGNTASTTRFLAQLASTARACRQVCPRAKIVIHTELVRNVSLMNNYYHAIAAADYDIIGLSYYPYYHYSLGQLDGALTNIEQNFPGKEVMIVEAGFYHDWQPTSGINYDYATQADPYGYTYAITAEGQRAFTAALVAKLLAHPVVTGLFWWWPEANEYGVNWQNPVTKSGWYNAGLWNNQNGRALPALSELAAFAPQQPATGDLNGDSSIDVDDLNMLINVILNKEQNPDVKALADLNGDGTVDIDDMNRLINLMLGKDS